MEDECDVDRLIDELIEREGGYRQPSRRQGRADLFRDHRGGGARARLCRADAPAPARGSGGDLPPPLLAAPALRRDREAQPAPRRRAVRHRRQHGAGGRRHLPSARADRAQPQRQGLSRPGPRRAHRPDDAVRARRLPRARSSPAVGMAGATNKEPAARPCCCARSKRCRASATSASPSAGQPTRRSSMAGWRTGLVSRAERIVRTVRTFVELPPPEKSNMSRSSPLPNLRRRPALHLWPARRRRGRVLRRLRRRHGRAADVGRLVAAPKSIASSSSSAGRSAASSPPWSQ